MFETSGDLMRLRLTIPTHKKLSLYSHIIVFYCYILQTYIASDIADLLLDNYVLDSYSVPSHQTAAVSQLTEAENVTAFRELIFYG